MKNVFHAAWFAVVCLAAAALSAQDKKDAPDTGEAYKNVVKYQFGQSRKDIAAIEEEIRKSAPQQYPAIEDKLLQALKTPDATADGKRFIVRMLGVAGSAKSVPAIAPLLGDEQLCHAARMALEPMADPAAGAALREALGKLKGKLLAGVISSIGVRRDPQAVSALSALVNDPQAEIATAAVRALGEIGTPEAAKALEGAVDSAKKWTAQDRRWVAKARAACAARLAQSGQGALAAGIYKSLLDSTEPPPIRVAGLNGLLATQQTAQAVATLTELLQGDDAAMTTAAVQAFCTATDKALKAAVVEKLTSLKPSAQAALLAVLGDQADVPARAALLRLLQDSKDQKLRIAAMEPLAVHGEPADVAMLLKTAKDASPEGAAARKVLEQMRKPGVNEALLAALESADPAGRGVILGALSARRAEAALPVLVKMMAGSDASAATDAVKALEVLGTAAQMTGIADILAATSDAGLRGAAEGAAAAICTRAADKQPCSQALLAAFDKAKAPAAKAALLRLLPRVRTAAALAAVRQAIQDNQPEVSEAAVRALADWPELTAAPPLLELAKTTTNDRYAILALQGCLKLAGVKDRPVSDRLETYRGVLEAAKRADEKKQALAGLADLPSMEALELIRKYLKDEALGADAAMAGVRLARQLGPVGREKCLAVLDEIKSLPSATDAIRKSVEEAIKTINDTGRADGYVIAWMLSGPYTKEGKGAEALFDEAFAPEKLAATGVEWRLVTATASSGPRVTELDKILGGSDRAAYLKTQITSDKAQEISLEIGSDDGAKVWLNGEVVLAKNVTRPCQPAEDKARMKLKQGVNTLLVKLTQGGGEWALCARLRSTDGKDAQGITVAPAMK